VSLPIEERWLPVVGYEGYYEVSDLGNVRSLDRRILRRGVPAFLRGRMLRQTTVDHGRAVVSLCRGGRRDLRRVSTIVLQAFVGEPPAGFEGCHNDGNPANNHLGNLRWDSHQTNMDDQYKHGTRCGITKTHCPRGHFLSAPNLVASMAKRGNRTCMACARARAQQQRAEKRGEFIDFVTESHARYADIMGSRQVARGIPTN